VGTVLLHYRANGFLKGGGILQLWKITPAILLFFGNAATADISIEEAAQEIFGLEWRDGPAIGLIGSWATIEFHKGIILSVSQNDPSTRRMTVCSLEGPDM